jgi:AraC-like DNA-binding protein
VGGVDHAPNLSIWSDRTFADYYVINYAHSGYLNFKMNNSCSVILHAPVAWWTYPGPRYEYGLKEDSTWDEYWVGFRGPRVRQFIKTELFPLRRMPPYIRITDPDRFRQSFESLLNHLDNPEYGQAHSVHLLEGLLLQLYEQQRTGTVLPSLDTKIRGLMKMIRENPAKPWDMAVESKRCMVSYSHLRRNFRSIASQAPNQFLMQARMDLAAKLLRNTNQALKEIADESGYEDIYHFSKLFKQHYGVAPGKYRRDVRLV